MAIMDEVFNFYSELWNLVNTFEKQLENELERYAKAFKTGEMNGFIFQLSNPVELEELPLLMLKLKKQPYFSVRWWMYEKKAKVEAIQRAEEYVKSLGINPIPRSSEIEEWIKSPE